MEAGDLTAGCKPIDWSMWDSRPFTALWASRGWQRDDFTFLFSFFCIAILVCNVSLMVCVASCAAICLSMMCLLCESVFVLCLYCSTLSQHKNLFTVQIIIIILISYPLPYLPHLLRSYGPTCTVYVCLYRGRRGY